MNRNYKSSAYVIAFSMLLFLFPLQAYAQTQKFDIPAYEGGISNETVYQEVMFISGRPVLLKGEFSIRPGRIKDGVATTSYSFKLENPEEQAELTRRISIETTYKKDEIKGQEVAISRITRFSETYEVGDTSYKLEDYQFSQSVITDSEPSAEYFAGNWDARKTYSINRNEGTVTVKVLGDIVGYNTPWSATHTMTQSYIIDYDGKKEISKNQFEDVRWSGSAEVKTAFNYMRRLRYVQNEPAWISFRGGYLKTEEITGVLTYTSLLPKFDTNGIPLDRMTKDSAVYNLVTLPIQERLPVPEYKDINGHWAQRDIERLTSLGIMTPKGSYFGPRFPMTRADFAKAVVKTAEMLEPEEPQKPSYYNRNREEQPKQEPLFADVPEDSEYFKYVQELGKRGVMTGTAPKVFGPNEYLTRAQALSVIIRALGLEKLAPNPPFNTTFTDDSKIPAWAKPSLYVAREIGLLRGDEYGRANPDEVMTRAEAAAFLNRFITYLQQDLKNDYLRVRLNY